MLFEELQRWPLLVMFFIIIFLSISYIPTNVLVILDLLFVRIIAVLFLLWTISQGPSLGILSFLVVAGLFMERNRRKLSSVKIRLYSEMATSMAAAEGADGLGNDGMQKGPERQATTDEESQSQKNVFVPPFEIPDLGNIWKWIPEDSCKEENWSAVAPTINNKEPTRTIVGGSKTWPFFVKNDLV